LLISSITTLKYRSV